MLVIGFALQIGMLVWVFFFVGFARRERAWWTRLAELFGKIPIFMEGFVQHLRMGMPRNAEACKRSADQTMAEIEQMLGRRSQKP